MTKKNKAFTLVEVLLASLISVFVTLTAVAVMRTVISAKEKTINFINVNDKLRFAGQMIKKDIANIYRDKNKEGMKFIAEILPAQANQMPTQSLMLNTIRRTKARPAEPETDVYEVQYFLKYNDLRDSASLMMRTCPRIAGIEEEKDLSAGIVILLAEDIESFDLRFFDGKQWQLTWPEDMENLPELVELNISASSADTKQILSKAFLMGFAKMPKIVNDSDNDKKDK